MIQRGCGLGFALEPGESPLVAGNIVRQKLEGHEAVQAHVFRFVNHSHTAATELLDDVVVRDGLANDFWPIIFGRSFLADHWGPHALRGHIRSQAETSQLLQTAARIWSDVPSSPTSWVLPSSRYNYDGLIE